MKILLATQKPFAAEAVAGIKKIFTEKGYETAVLEKYSDNSELTGAVSDADAIIIRSDKMTPEVFDAAKKLKIVVRAGAGYDNVDLCAATAHNVVVMNTPGQNSNAVAELAIAFMIFMSRNQFTPAAGSEIEGKKLGIQAFGNVGCLVCEKAKALGMQVVADDPFVCADKISEGGAIPITSLEDMYSSCDFISLHIPATPQTVKSIGYDLITRMPKNGVLVNTARKEIIDEDGLEKALESRPDLKYITDVMPDNYEELKAKFGLRVFATPKKMGAQTKEANVNAGLAAAHQIVNFFESGCTKFQVNKNK
ncbi:MAG: 3-phosphoglycerate dehydrogenase [Bacteroidales bacterium]|jgi:D-3-phosphoglycerate dehydrogenase|nr:3-phosphoglycerate dehydrogenase [Bacteroidales bacterium]MCI1784614.1 3-phosphoglycerate dehydrogenase [Bacteroidales bacterium]